MPKKKSDESLSKAATLERFERALRNALSTPPGKPGKAKKKAKRAKRK